ncbi:MAG: hypothetical protein WD749_03965 [Phycisphaerales bacterium]
MRNWLIALALAAAALATPLAPAQDRPAPRGTPRPAPSPAAPPTAAGAMELAEEPFRLEAVGLTLRLPAGAQAQTSRAADQQSVQVVPAGPNPDWLFTIQTPQSRNTETTARAVAEDVLEQLKRSVGELNRTVDAKGTLTEKLVSTRAQVIEEVRDLTITAEPQHTRPAARFYVRLPGGDKRPAIIRGYTVFRTEPGRFVTFDLTTTEPAFARAKQAYETSIATARFVDAGAMLAARGAAVEGGIALIGGLSPAEFDATVNRMKDQWYRLSRRAPGAPELDTEEIGYRRVRAWRGKRGEIDPTKTPGRFKGPDHQEGYLLRIDARVLSEGNIVDTVGVYFMAPDRSEEAWSLQTAVRTPDRAKPFTASEIGARTGPAMSVVITGDAREAKRIEPLVPRHGYLNQLEAFLLPQLLIGRQKPAEMGFYAYNSERESIALRRDVLGQPDARGNWQITTRMREDADPQVSVYNAKGDLTQTAFKPDPDGRVRMWTPITLQRLADLWRAKGLPMN